MKGRRRKAIAGKCIHSFTERDVSVLAEMISSASFLSFSCARLAGMTAAGNGKFPPFPFLQGFSHIPLHRPISYVPMITPFPNSKNTKALTGCHPVRAF
jgi:hypothetical protein